MSFSITSSSSRNYRIKKLEPYNSWYDFEFYVDIPVGDSSDNLIGDYGFNDLINGSGTCVNLIGIFEHYSFSATTICEKEVSYNTWCCSDVNQLNDIFHFVYENKTSTHRLSYYFINNEPISRACFTGQSVPAHYDINNTTFKFYKGEHSGISVDIQIARMLATAESCGCDSVNIWFDSYDYVYREDGTVSGLDYAPDKGYSSVFFYKSPSFGWRLVTPNDMTLGPNDEPCMDFRHTLNASLCEKLNFNEYYDNHYCSDEDRCEKSCPDNDVIVYDGNFHSTADVCDVGFYFFDSGSGYVDYNSKGCPCEDSEDDMEDCECICAQLNSLNYNIVNGLSDIDDSIFLLGNKLESLKNKLSGDITDYSDKMEESLNDINNVLLSLSNLFKSSCDTSITDVLSEAFNTSNCSGSVFKTTLGGVSLADSFSQSFNMLDGYGSVFKDNSLTLDDSRSFFNLIKDMFKNPCDNSGLTGLSYLFSEAFNRENCEGSVFKDNYDIYHTITDYFENAFFKIDQPFLQYSSGGSSLPAYRFSGFNLGSIKNNSAEFSFTDVLRRSLFSLNSDVNGVMCRIQDSHFFNGGVLSEKLQWLDCSNNPVNLKFCPGEKPTFNCPDVTVNVPVPSVTVENNIPAVTPTIKNYVHTDNYVDTIVESNNWSYQARSKYDFFNENDS